MLHERAPCGCGSLKALLCFRSGWDDVGDGTQVTRIDKRVLTDLLYLH